MRKAQGVKPAPIIEGTPQVPVLSIHTIGDLFVPIEMEQIYAREVAANGRSDLLVQRAIRDVGHCTFSELEWTESFEALFTWLEDGTRPAGDDLVDGIADPTLGCGWTESDATADVPTGVRVFDVFGCP